MFNISAAILFSLHVLSAQDLAPRAYVITPLHANAITLTYSFYDGSINYNGALPVSGATGTYIQRPDIQLLPLLRLVWSVGQHCRLIALRRGNFSWNSIRRGAAPVPFWSSGFGLSLLRQS